MSTLNKEVWTSQIMENFYPDSTFLKYARDFTSLVDNNKINLADCGFDPNVLINNSTYPINIVERDDTPISIELDLFETENTLVRKPEAVELAYDKLESVISGHRNSLRASTASKAAHAYAPAGNTANTPIIVTTGEVDVLTGKKKLVPKDILSLKRAFDKIELPLEDRYLVLEPNHISDLIEFDLSAFKDITDFVEGKPRKFAGFNILQFSRTAKYDFTTLTKKAIGSVDDENTTECSFAFHSGEVMKSDGDVGMYERIDDPELRATIVGFDKRFIALPIRNKGIGAIVSAIPVTP